VATSKKNHTRRNEVKPSKGVFVIRTSQTCLLASSEDGSKLVDVRSGAEGGAN